jgi:hypothetical protein
VSPNSIAPADPKEVSFQLNSRHVALVLNEQLGLRVFGHAPIAANANGLPGGKLVASALVAKFVAEAVGGDAGSGSRKPQHFSAGQLPKATADLTKSSTSVAYRDIDFTGKTYLSNPAEALTIQKFEDTQNDLGW